MNESDPYREWAPPEAWRDVVACRWEQRVHGERTQRVLPDGHADVLLYGSGEVQLVGVYDHVAERLGVSSRQLQRSIVRNVGLTPKTLQRVMRLQRFLDSADRGDALAAASADAGYADQSHLTREVRALSGLTPARLLAERGDHGPASGSVGSRAHGVFDRFRS